MTRAARVVLVQSPIFDLTTPSNGLALISAHLRARGIEPAVYDASLSSRLKFERQLGRPFDMFETFDAEAHARRPHFDRILAEEARAIADLEPDVAAFSVLTLTERFSLALAAELKKLLPRCRVIFGGAQCHRDTLADDFIRRPEVDAVAAGEADLSFPRFVAAWDPASDELPAVPGMIVKNGETIVDGGISEVVQNLDDLPYLDFSGFRMDDYSGENIFLSTTRGCVRKCAFCTHIVHHKTYRTMSPRRTVAEIRHQLAAYPRRSFVEFNDSLVNGNVRRLADISDLLVEMRMERLARKEPADFGWTGMAIIHPTMTPQLLRKLRWGGCFGLRYGLESASQRVVDLMGKDFRVADAEKIIRDTKEAGIAPYLFILVGFPGETEKDFQLTLDFVARNREHLGGASVSIAEIQRGARLDVEAERFGIKTPISDRIRWTTVDGSNTHAVRKDREKRAMDLLKKLALDRRYNFSTRIGNFTGASA